MYETFKWHIYNKDTPIKIAANVPILLIIENSQHPVYGMIDNYGRFSGMEISEKKIKPQRVAPFGDGNRDFSTLKKQTYNPNKSFEYTPILFKFDSVFEMKVKKFMVVK